MADKGPNWEFSLVEKLVMMVINCRFLNWTTIVKVGPNAWFHDPVNVPRWIWPIFDSMRVKTDFSYSWGKFWTRFLDSRGSKKVHPILPLFDLWACISNYLLLIRPYLYLNYVLKPDQISLKVSKINSLDFELIWPIICPFWLKNEMWAKLSVLAANWNQSKI